MRGLEATLRRASRELGFERIGFARADTTPEADALTRFVMEQRHGEMQWFADTLSVRRDPRHENMLSGAKTVIVVAHRYQQAALQTALGRVARYAAGRDYHNVMSKRLKKLTRHLSEAGAISRVAVDSKPVAERAWAERAGLGFIGKNACLIIPGLGSHLFLGAIVTTADLTPDSVMPRRCGACRACLDGCPTNAFDGEHRLDARRCISYITIEKKPDVAPVALDHAMGDWVFGCDVCQDVCPYNRGKHATRATDPAYAADDARWSKTPEEVLNMNEAAFTAWMQGSPAKRPRLRGWQQNVLRVLRNDGSAASLAQIRKTANAHPDSEIRILARRYCDEPNA